MMSFSKVYRFILLILLVCLGVFAGKAGVINYITDPYEYPIIARLFWQHLCLVSTSISIATIIGLGAGIIATRSRFKKVSGLILYIIGLGQTIPSLAVLAISMSVLGIGFKPAVFAMTIYSILPIARNTLAGISNLSPALIDAAKGMGMPPIRILVEVELPNAMSVIIAGFRIALVINIGTGALAFLIGAGGLGDLIFTGISLMQMEKLLAGVIPLTLMALVADFCCEKAERRIVPRGLKMEKQT